VVEVGQQRLGRIFMVVWTPRRVLSRTVRPGNRLVISNERVMPHATKRSVGSAPTCSPRADLEIGAGARDQPAEASGDLAAGERPAVLQRRVSRLEERRQFGAGQRASHPTPFGLAVAGDEQAPRMP
jgi:hypothetical protein